MSIINRYKLKEGVQYKDILAAADFREGGKWINAGAKYFLSRTYIQKRTKLELDIAIAIPEEDSMYLWNDFDWALVLDEDFGQPYTPFYSAMERGGEVNTDGLSPLEFAIDSYNSFMDSLPFLEKTTPEQYEMVVLDYSGTRSTIKLTTTKGVFRGKGEMLTNGFVVYRESVTDDNGNAPSDDVIQELEKALAKHYLNTSKDFRIRLVDPKKPSQPAKAEAPAKEEKVMNITVPEEISDVNFHIDGVGTIAVHVERSSDTKPDPSKEALDDMRNALMETLRSKIGQPIYWAHKDWNKFEKHIVSDIQFGVIKSDFWADEYGTEQVQILIDDNSGRYLAKDIGYTLFWSEEEAKAHTALAGKAED